MFHNNPEDRRVKFPALAHMTRLGYTYLKTHRLKSDQMLFDEQTKIAIGIFRKALVRINTRRLSDSDFEEIIRTIRKILDSDDLGEKFTQALLTGVNGWKLIDFSNPSVNDLAVATEVTIHAKDASGQNEDEFRPDIMVYVNGLPLSFIEVKRENNLSGVQAERDRMDERSSHPGYRSFLNMMQFVAFTNNMEYNDAEQDPRSGGFYTAINPGKQYLNRMRDEEDRVFAAKNLPHLSDETIRQILEDNNIFEIYSDSAFRNRLAATTPANAFITSLYRPDRFFFLFRYGITYRTTRQKDGLVRPEKHVMRYPQIFATHAIARYLDSGHSKGVIWHTQGSGKTALVYFNVHYLTDYYQYQDRVAQFFFIVDRLDLAQQAKAEFEARGLEVTLARSREDFANITSRVAIPSSSGKRHITVVNIHKFSEDSTIGVSDYAANVQRVYFIDEAHRSYDPSGSFLANLFSSDRSAVMIALTGTPLLGKDKATKEVFGPYIHTYYYNQSIADGYTLRLMRERIATEYQQQLSEALERLQVQIGSVTLNQVKEHPNYIESLANYVSSDLLQTRLRLNDETIGGMVVCCSTNQARALHEWLLAAHPDMSFGLILHDEGDKISREDAVAAFKAGNVDMLIVYNMLLTGFDAPRLKRLYLERLVAKHNLLQTLTRVNRPYKKHQFGSVIDFADISDEFEKTNQAYLKELREQLGDQWDQYTKVIISKEEIVKAVQEIKDVLWEYDLNDISTFIDQINGIEDRGEISKLRRALLRYLALYNQIRLQDNNELFSYFDIENARNALNEVILRASTLASMEAAQNGDYSQLINVALDATQFRFSKLSESELQVADAFLNTVKRLYEERERNLDPKDPEYNTLLTEIEKLFKKQDFLELTAEELDSQIIEIEKYRERIKAINERNARLTQKYHGDEKFMRIHKRIEEESTLVTSGARLAKFLDYVKTDIDATISTNENLLGNPAFFEREVQRSVVQACKQPEAVSCNGSYIKYLATLVTSEYTTNMRRSA